MTVLIAGLPAALDVAPSADVAPKAQSSSRSDGSERDAPFGPALEEAQAAVRRGHAEADPIRDVDEGPSSDVVESDDTADPSATPHSAHLATATESRIAVPDHPTAKGESGEGSPSIDPTIEAAAAPTAATQNSATTTEATSPEAMPSAIEGEVAGAVTAAAVNDQNADRVEAAGQALSDDSGPRVDATPPPAVDRSSAAGAPDDGPTAASTGAGTISSSPSPSSTAAAAAGPTGATAPGPAGALVGGTVDAPIDDADVSSMAVAPETHIDVDTTSDAASPTDDAAAAPTSAGRATSGGSESLLAPGRQEARTISVSAAAGDVSAGAPSAGPLGATEEGLWEDVRLAFGRIRSSENGQEVRIRLRPAELGELVVHVRTNGEHVSVKLTASSAAAQQMLADDRLRLAEELARAGFDEGLVDIATHDGDNSFGDARHRRNADDAEDTGRGALANTPGVSSGRADFEEREPIRTQAAFRAGRNAYSTINLTL